LRETRQEGGQCSIGRVKAWMSRLAFWRRGRRSPETPTPPAEDARAEELRRKLEESRTVAEEQHEEAASPEIPVDEADVESRRAAVHERARASADEMRGE